MRAKEWIPDSYDEIFEILAAILAIHLAASFAGNESIGNNLAIYRDI